MVNISQKMNGVEAAFAKICDCGGLFLEVTEALNGTTTNGESGATTHLPNCWGKINATNFHGNWLLFIFQCTRCKGQVVPSASFAVAIIEIPSSCI